MQNKIVHYFHGSHVVWAQKKRKFYHIYSIVTFKLYILFRMEYQFHELNYMKSSLELLDVKEEIEGLLRDKHKIDKKIETRKSETSKRTNRKMHKTHKSVTKKGDDR